MPYITIEKVIDQTRIPIIKLVVALEGMADEVCVDLSIEGPHHTGIATAAFVTQLTTHLPHLVPLTLVLKHFLKQRDLSDPYTGEKGALFTTTTTTTDY